MLIVVLQGTSQVELISHLIKLIKKRETTLEGSEELIVSLYAKGMSEKI